MSQGAVDDGGPRDSVCRVMEMSVAQDREADGDQTWPTCWATKSAPLVRWIPVGLEISGSKGNVCGKLKSRCLSASAIEAARACATLVEHAHADEIVGQHQNPSSNMIAAAGCSTGGQ